MNQAIWIPVGIVAAIASVVLFFFSFDTLEYQTAISGGAMAFDLNDIKPLLAQYDIQGTVGATLFPDESTILGRVISREFHEDRIVLTLEQFSPEGWGIECFSQDILSVPQDVVLQTQMMLWDKSQQLPEMNRKYWFKHVRQIDLQVNFVFHAHSLCLPIHSELPINRPVHHLELYAGGLGGWKAATQFLERYFGDMSFNTIAIEHDRDLAVAYALSHAANLIHMDGEIPCDMLMNGEDWIIVGDASADEWQQAVTHWQVDCCTISAPCPPWSGATSAPGLAHHNGKLFLKSVLDCRYWRPHMILIENVPGFASHDHKQWIERALHMIGYKLTWQGVINVATTLRTNRPRWLAVATRVHADFSPVLIRNFTMEVPPTPELKVKFPLCALNFQKLLLDDQAHQVASDPRAASFMRTPEAHNPEHVFSMRIYDEDQICPTFMAKYGTQHRLDERHLLSNNYYGHFIKEDVLERGCRRWHPAEVLLKHGCTGATFLWDNHEQSWLLLGNMITPVQALVPLLQFLNQLRSESIDIQQVLQEYQSYRFSADHVTFQQMDGGYFVVPKTHPMSDQTLVRSQQLITKIHSDDPGDFVWFFASGLAVDDSDELPPNDLIPLSQVSEVSERAGTQMDDLTAPFDTVMQGSLQLDTESQTFWFSSSIRFDMLSCPWNWKFIVICNESTDFGQPSVILHPSVDSQFVEAHDSTVAVILQDDQCTLVPLDMHTPMMSQPIVATLSAIPHDQFGPLTDNQKPDFAMLLTPVPFQPGDVETPLPVLVTAYQMIRGEIHWNSSTDTILFAFQGDQVAVDTMTEFLSSIMPYDELQRCGRKLSCLSQGDAATIAYAPDRTHGVVPPRPFGLLLGIMATKSLLDQLQPLTRSDADSPVRVKWLGRPVWNGFLTKDTTMQVLLQVLQVSLFASCGGTNFRIVCAGKLIMPEVVLGDLPYLEHSEYGDQIVLNVVQQTRGGGPSKQQQRTLQQGALATMLLEQGHDLGWVTSTVDKLISKHSLSTIQNVTGMPMGAARINALHSLCEACGLEIPTPKPLSSHAKPVGAPWTRPKKFKTEEPAIDPSQYRIVDNYFRNQDDTPACQLSDLRPQSSGVYLASPGTALPWLRAGQKVSSDELGLVIVGQLPIETSLESKPIKVPCLNKMDQMVLLTCNLVQLGSKRIECQKPKQTQLDTDSSTLVALTVNREDWPQDMWQEFLQAPHATFKKVLTQESLDVMTSMWGKSMRAGRSPASPSAAQSLQIHVTLPNDKVELFLSKSGYNRIFATPKLQDGRLDTKYKVIWMADPSEVTVCAAKLTAPMGMVKGKDNVGLRVKEVDYEGAFKLVFPDSPIPSKPSGDLVYKCDGLPFGVTQQTMVAWLSSLGWSATPFKPIGPQAWLIRTNVTAPPGVIMFNSSPVLLRLLPARQQQKQSLILGPRSEGLKRGADPMQQTSNDPWARFQGVNNPVAPQAPRAVDGPTQQRLQAQDEKIAVLQADMAKMSNAISHNHQQVTQQVCALEKHTDQMCTQIATNVTQMRSEFEGALKESLRVNTEMMDGRMNELRSLLMQNNKRNQPCKGEDEDMHASG
eukprot:Skav206894  [mRNA]  locus=scaffold2387:153648:159125:+ [translate_table: standard]